MSPFSDRHLKSLRDFFGQSLSTNEPLSAHCTYRIGGPAEYFISLSSEEKLSQGLEYCHEEHIPVMVLGRGSNILFPDEGLHGVVVQTVANEVVFQNDNAIVQAGTPLPKLARSAAEHSLSGLEFASGIPGTAGGAVIMNAGFKGQCMGDIVDKVSGYELIGRKFSIDKEQLEFRYRSSSLRNARKLLTQVVLRLSPGGPEEIKKRMADFNKERRNNQPIEYPSAGSVFKNPPERPAWKLIEEAGCKGLRVGNAQVSEKHGNYIINLGNATYNDVKKLIEIVVERVCNTSGIMLDLEILDIGTGPQRRKELQ